MKKILSASTTVGLYGKLMLFGFLGGCGIGAALQVFSHSSVQTTYKFVAVFLLLTLVSNFLAKAMVSFLQILKYSNE